MTAEQKPSKPLKQLKRHLSRVAPTIDVVGRAQHRRIGGQFSSSVEGNCYAKVFFIAQAGIGKFEKKVREVCRAVAQVQYGSRRGDYHIEMRVFGATGDVPMNKIRVREPPAINRIARNLVEQAGDAPGTREQTIVDVGKPAKGDLVVVFCMTLDVCLGQQAANRLAKMRAKHVIWALLDEDCFDAGLSLPASGREMNGIKDPDEREGL